MCNVSQRSIVARQHFQQFDLKPQVGVRCDVRAHASFTIRQVRGHLQCALAADLHAHQADVTSIYLVTLPFLEGIQFALVIQLCESDCGNPPLLESALARLTPTFQEFGGFRFYKSPVPSYITRSIDQYRLLLLLQHHVSSVLCQTLLPLT